MRVVLDTNVLISAALKPHGLEAAVVRAVLTGALEAWITEETWAEYEDVLSRPKFAGIRAEASRILEAVQMRAQRTTAITVSSAAIDEDDNRFLECAHAAQADFLITGNRRHYPEQLGVTRIINARELVEMGLL